MMMQKYRKKRSNWAIEADGESSQRPSTRLGCASAFQDVRQGFKLSAITPRRLTRGVWRAKSGFGIEGTVMVFKTPTVAPFQYLAQGKSEDSFFITDVRRATGPSGVWDNPPNLYFRFFHGINTWNGVHYQINKLPGDNAWCSNLETRTFGCESEMDNELHHFVRGICADVVAALAAAPKES
ncbi:uncharacterized protein MONBRDRAFT_8146 [Monosiga brevicollis MX1]|uniref:Uncharacterized protein n=1 Tax=Monosiga brevicollis TaxID=81824 RepID=A9UZ63_MONBE|nr:uncharacterized protein MONBRDRAFT_8146 [Monosiga brevicollis MX1]EDQ89311.1 predicted protein [Monosiga brevicollis MX1]|eukprot:XP_001745887.1 hypothetical protein [Monosiga brevicollis MX1]